MTLAWQTDLPPTEKIVLLALADSANDKGVSWPAVSELCEKTGLSDRSVQHATQAFVARGWLTIHRRYKQSSLYEIHVEHLRSTATASPERPSPEAPSAEPDVNLTRKLCSSDPNDVRPLNPKTLTSLSLNEPSKKNRQREPSTRAREATARNVSRETDPEWFLEFKLAYPDRAGDQGWRKASKAANARFAEGHTPAELIAGARRYAAFIEATGKSATEYVKQAATFLGPDKPFLLPWKPPPKAETATDRMLRMLNATDDRVIEHEDPGKFLLTSQ